MCNAAYDELCLVYSFVKPELTKLQDVLSTIEWQVKHYGIKMASIYPFNVLEIEQAIGASETEVINRALDFNVETNRYEDPEGDNSVADQEDSSWLRLS